MILVIVVLIAGSLHVFAALLASGIALTPASFTNIYILDVGISQKYSKVTDASDANVTNILYKFDFSIRQQARLCSE